MFLGIRRYRQTSKRGHERNGSLAARTVCTGNSTKTSNIDGDLNYNIQTEMETRVVIMEVRHLLIVWCGKTDSLR